MKKILDPNLFTKIFNFSNDEFHKTKILIIIQKKFRYVVKNFQSNKQLSLVEKLQHIHIHFDYL